MKFDFAIAFLLATGHAAYAQTDANKPFIPKPIRHGLTLSA